MNTSSFMDKQIMDLTAAGQATASLKSTTTVSNNSDYIDLVNHRRVDNDDDDDDDDEGDDNLKKEDIIPSYDFKPLRPIVQSSTSSIGVSRASNLVTSSPPPPPPIKNYGSLDSIEPVRATFSKDGNAHDGSMLSAIDGIMKKHTDNLLHALEGVSARMTQLETRTRNLENLVDDINVAVGNNHGSTDGKMRHLENILREVQTGVQVLRDKHEIIEAQLELSKLQVSHTQQQSKKQNTSGSSSAQQTIAAPLQETVPQHQVPSTPQQGYQQFPTPALPPPFSMPQNAVATAPLSQPLAPQLQMPNQFPQNHSPQTSQYPTHGQTQEAPNQHYQHTPTQQTPPPLPHPSSAPLQQYHGSYPSYSQPHQQQTSMPPLAPPQVQPSANIHQEEAPYIPPQSYGPPPQQPLSHPSAGSQSQQYYGPPPPSQAYDLPPPRSNVGYQSGYGPPAGPNEPSYPYGGSAQYGGSSKPPHAPPGGSGYPQLPTARILPQAIPTASAVSGGSGSSGTGNNRVPVDDVIDKVSSMGFSREQVRATVRRLTENGQSVDLNIVLDKLMNG